MSTERAVPILPVDDLGLARRFYVDALGFEVAFESTADGKSGLLGVRRGSIHITLDGPMSGHGRNACASLVVDSADRYYEEWRHRARVERPPKDEDWGARTFDLMDPFGNTIVVIGPAASGAPGDPGGYSESQVLNLARTAYRQGDAAFALVPEKCALLVIDMQDEFVKPGWTPYWVPEATRQVPAVAQLIRDCRGLRIPVVFTVFSNTHGYLDRPASGGLMPNRYPELGVDQSAWFVEGRVWHELSPLPGDVVIHKPSYGAFYDTPLETILKNLARDTVIICGTLTNYCCGTTARQAYERGFKVVVGSDVTATDDPEMQEAELMVLRKGFARVLAAEEIVRQLRTGR